MVRSYTMGTVGFATLAGLAVAGQGPVTPLPIPELPRVEVTPSPGFFNRQVTTTHLPIAELPDPKPLPLPPLAKISESTSPSQPAFLPAVVQPIQSNPSEFRLQTLPAGHNLIFEAARETLPEPRPSEAFDNLPANESINTIPQREDTVMPIDHKSILAAAVGTVMSVSSAYADDQKIPPSSDSGQSSEKTEKIEKPNSPDLKKELDEVKSLLNALTAKQQTLGDAVSGKAGDPGLTKKVDELASSIKTLQETVKSLDDKITKVNENLEKVRTSFSSPLTRDVKPTEIAKDGIVKLVNQYGDSVTLLLNGKPIKLAVGETKDVKIPAGTFEYALPLAGGEVKTSQVRDNEIVTLKIK